MRSMTDSKDNMKNMVDAAGGDGGGGQQRRLMGGGGEIGYDDHHDYLQQQQQQQSQPQPSNMHQLQVQQQGEPQQQLLSEMEACKLLVTYPKHYKSRVNKRHSTGTVQHHQQQGIDNNNNSSKNVSDIDVNTVRNKYSRPQTSGIPGLGSGGGLGAGSGSGSGESGSAAAPYRRTFTDPLPSSTTKKSSSSSPPPPPPVRSPSRSPKGSPPRPPRSPPRQQEQHQLMVGIVGKGSFSSAGGVQHHLTRTVSAEPTTTACTSEAKQAEAMILSTRKVSASGSSKRSLSVTAGGSQPGAFSYIPIDPIVEPTTTTTPQQTAADEYHHHYGVSSSSSSPTSAGAGVNNSGRETISYHRASSDIVVGGGSSSVATTSSHGSWGSNANNNNNGTRGLRRPGGVVGGGGGRATSTGGGGGANSSSGIPLPFDHHRVDDQQSMQSQQRSTIRPQRGLRSSSTGGGGGGPRRDSFSNHPSPGGNAILNANPGNAILDASPSNAILDSYIAALGAFDGIDSGGAGIGSGGDDQVTVCSMQSDQRSRGGASTITAATTSTASTASRRRGLRGKKGKRSRTGGSSKNNGPGALDQHLEMNRGSQRGLRRSSLHRRGSDSYCDNNEADEAQSVFSAQSLERSRCGSAVTAPAAVVTSSGAGARQRAAALSPSRITPPNYYNSPIRHHQQEPTSFISSPSTTSIPTPNTASRSSDYDAKHHHHHHHRRHHHFNDDLSPTTTTTTPQDLMIPMPPRLSLTAGTTTHSAPTTIGRRSSLPTDSSHCLAASAERQEEILSAIQDSDRNLNMMLQSLSLNLDLPKLEDPASSVAMMTRSSANYDQSYYCSSTTQTEDEDHRPYRHHYHYHRHTAAAGTSDDECKVAMTRLSIIRRIRGNRASSSAGAGVDVPVGFMISTTRTSSSATAAATSVHHSQEEEVDPYDNAEQQSATDFLNQKRKESFVHQKEGEGLYRIEDDHRLSLSASQLQEWQSGGGGAEPAITTSTTTITVPATSAIPVDVPKEEENDDEDGNDEGEVRRQLEQDEVVERLRSEHEEEVNQLRSQLAALQQKLGNALHDVEEQKAMISDIQQHQQPACSYHHEHSHHHHHQQQHQDDHEGQVNASKSEKEAANESLIDEAEVKNQTSKAVEQSDHSEEDETETAGKAGLLLSGETIFESASTLEYSERTSSEQSLLPQLEEYGESSEPTSSDHSLLPQLEEYGESSDRSEDSLLPHPEDEQEEWHSATGTVTTPAVAQNSGIDSSQSEDSDTAESMLREETIFESSERSSSLSEQGLDLGQRTGTTSASRPAYLVRKKMDSNLMDISYTETETDLRDETIIEGSQEYDETAESSSVRRLQPHLERELKKRVSSRTSVLTKESSELSGASVAAAGAADPNAASAATSHAAATVISRFFVTGKLFGGGKKKNKDTGVIPQPTEVIRSRTKARNKLTKTKQKGNKFWKRTKKGEANEEGTTTPCH